MMLAGVPGKVGDGVKTTLSYTKTDGSTTAVSTYVGKKPVADTLKRFLVGAEGLRDHRFHGNAGRQDAVREHPAPG